MQKNEVSVLGVSEVRWKGQGEIRSDDYTLYYSGSERAEKAVAIVVHKSIERSVVKKIVCNERIIAIKLQAEPINILMMQVYLPKSEHEDEEVEELYDIIEKILEEDGKGNTITTIMGDWNSIVGDEPYRNVVGPHGIGRKNHRVEMLINFCERNGLIVTNTWFRKPKKRLYTWKVPGDWRRHQLDYIHVLHRFRNSVKYMQTLPRADIDSDHNILVVKISTRLKEIIRFQNRIPQRHLAKLYTQKQTVQDTLEEKIGAIGCDSGNVEVRWNNIKECVLDTISDLVGKSRRWQENHGLHRKWSVKWMKEGNGRMSTLKKARRTTGS